MRTFRRRWCLLISNFAQIDRTKRKSFSNKNGRFRNRNSLLSKSSSKQKDEETQTTRCFTEISILVVESVPKFQFEYFNFWRRTFSLSGQIKKQENLFDSITTLVELRSSHNFLLFRLCFYDCLVIQRTFHFPSDCSNKISFQFSFLKCWARLRQYGAESWNSQFISTCHRK